MLQKLCKMLINKQKYVEMLQYSQNLKKTNFFLFSHWDNEGKNSESLSKCNKKIEKFCKTFKNSQNLCMIKTKQKTIFYKYQKT